MLLARHRAGQRHKQPPIFRVLLHNPFITYGVVRKRKVSDQLQRSDIKLLLQTAGLSGDFLCCVVTLGPGLL